MRKLVGTFCLMLLPLWVAAQTPLEQLAKIQADENYIWA